MKSNVIIKAKSIVNAEITSNELITGLIKTFELDQVFYPGYGFYWEIEQIDDIEVLNGYEDIGYHGTPCYKLRRTISNTKTIEAYKCIKKLKELIKEGE